MDNIVASSNYGFYGKVPSAGDFISREISHHYIKHIDGWFCAGMANLSFGESPWLDSYLTAPVWNFVIFPGVWGEEYLYGAVMPSVDSVGRYFPFMALLNRTCSDDLDSAAVSYLASLADEIPIILQRNILPAAIGSFLTQHVTANTSTVDELLPFGSGGANRGKSYWWCTAQEPAVRHSLVHSGAPDCQLFKRLFFGFQSPLL